MLGLEFLRCLYKHECYIDFIKFFKKLCWKMIEAMDKLSSHWWWLDSQKKGTLNRSPWLQSALAGEWLLFSFSFFSIWKGLEFKYLIYFWWWIWFFFKNLFLLYMTVGDLFQIYSFDFWTEFSLFRTVLLDSFSLFYAVGRFKNLIVYKKQSLFVFIFD